MVKTPEQWDEEVAYCRSIDKAYPVESFSNSVETFVRYLSVMIADAAQTHQYETAKQIEEIKNEALYLDYCNNFLSVERFAEHYGLWPELARGIIEEQQALRG